METLNCNLLTPIEKSRCPLKRRYPFPIIRSNCKEDQIDSKWRCAEGFLQEDCVLVNDEDDIKLLYTRGFFGKGTLSRNAPEICFKSKNRDNVPEIKQPESPDAKLEEDIIDVIDDEEEDAKIRKASPELEVVLSDSSNSGDGPPKKKNKTSSQESPEEKESLQLTLEEAYYLSYGLGALVVKDNKSQPVDLARLWNKFCELSIDDNFPVMYTAYHHFRSKGWVVKPGIKYGVDYLLYKDGPPFYHATYSVVVKHVKEQNLREARNSRQFTWASLFALNRLNSSTKKGLMFLYVIKPSTISENKISTPFCVSQYRLEEVLFKRWVASESREEGTEEENND